MKLGLNLTDYRIASTGIYKFTLVSFGVLLSAILLAEIAFDLRATSVEILAPSMVALFATILLAFRYPNSKYVKIQFITLLFVMIELHFLFQPVIFHTIIFWFPFVPLLALIILGIRSSLVWFVVLLAALVFNSYHLNQVVGDSYTIEIFRIPVFTSAIIFTIAISINSFILYHLLGKAYLNSDNKKKEIEKIKTKIERKKNLLENYMREFIRFSKDDSNFNQGQKHLFESICATTSRTLHASRVSVWLFNDDRTAIERQMLVENNSAFEEVASINKADYPNYFEALETQPYIMAPNAQMNNYTREFTENYFKSNNIFSLLDCPIMADRKPIGVICCEQQNEIKHWNVEDALFLQSIADFISMSYKNQRIERLLEELQQKNSALKAKNKEIELMNAALDTTVQKRTKALKTQNARLTEYSFINSHLLRAPLIRILGLSQYLVEEATSVRENELFKALIDSTDELDIIIRKINDVLYAGNGLTREDLISIEEDLRTQKKI